MGGGDNEITIRAILDAVGFEKGTQRLQKAVGSLSNSAKSLGNSAKSYAALAQRSLGSIAGVVKRITPMLLGVGSAYGVISKAVSAFMSENQLLASKMNSIWTALGNILGPIITQVINWITTAVSYFIEFLRLLGITTKTASEASKSAKGAGGALQKTLAGFDELNLLSSGGGGGGGGAGLSDPEDLPKWIEMLANALKNKLWNDAADIIIGKFNDLIHTFAVNAEKFGKAAGEYLQGAIHVISRVLNEVNWKELGVGIANFFNGLIAEVEGIDFGRDLGALLVAKITVAFKILTGFLETLKWDRVAEILTGIVTGALDALTAAIRGADFKKIGAGIREFFENIDWEAIKNSLFGFLSAVWNGALDLLWGLIAGDTAEEPPLVKSLENLANSVKELGESLVPIIDNLWNNYLKPFADWLVNNGIPDAIDAIAGRIQDLADLLSGDISFGEFISNMTHLEGALSGVAAVMGTIKFGGFISDVKKLSSKSVFGKLVEVVELVSTKTGTLGESIAVVFPGIGKAFANLKTAIGTVGGAFSKLFSFLAANPFVIVIAAVVGLIAYLVHLYNTNEEFREKVKEVWAAVDEAIGTAVDWIKEKWEAFKEALGALKDKFTEFKESAVEKWNSFKEAIDPANIKESVVTNFEEMKNSAIEKFGTLKDQASEKWKAIKTSVANSFTSAKDSVVESGEAILSKISSVFDESDSKVLNTVQDIASVVFTNFGSIKDSVFNAMGEVGKSIIDNLTNSDLTAGEKIRNIATTAIDSFSEIASNVSGFMYDIVSAIDENWGTSLASTIDFLSELVSSIVSAFSDAVSAAATWGADLIQNFWNGIKSQLSGFFSGIGEIAQGIKNILGFSEPKEGPLSDFHTYGPDMMKLYAEGIDHEKGRVINAVTGLADNISDAFSLDSVSGGVDMSALGAIGSNVPFSMPAVAGGDILPYSVGGGGWGDSSSSDNSDVLAAIAQLRETISDLQFSLENMQWVLKFGNVRAVVEEITKVQKQISRSGGG